jgi:hypothetical protein
VPFEQHLRFMDHMAALHAQFWGWTDDASLLPRTHRHLFSCQTNIDTELARPDPAPIPQIMGSGWRRFAATSAVAGPVGELRRNPWPVVDALGGLPQTLLHGDWKMGNLGSHPDGRTILLDWAIPGQGCGTSELAWYLALNAARLPHPKDDAIAAYRAALERHGIDTASWWDAAVDLALLGGLVQCGWEKALGDRGELAWWEEAAARGLERL